MGNFISGYLGGLGGPWPAQNIIWAKEMEQWHLLEAYRRKVRISETENEGEVHFQSRKGCDFLLSSFSCPICFLFILVLITSHLPAQWDFAAFVVQMLFDLCTNGIKLVIQGFCCTILTKLTGLLNACRNLGKHWTLWCELNWKLAYSVRVARLSAYDLFILLQPVSFLSYMQKSF